MKKPHMRAVFAVYRAAVLRGDRGTAGRIERENPALRPRLVEYARQLRRGK